MFPRYGKNNTIFNFINSRNNNLDRTKYVPWIRLISSVDNINGTRGLVLESIPSSVGFANRYGNSITNSGMVGSDWAGNPVFATETGEFGKKLNPSPTISAITIEQGANALTNKFSFSIKCNTKAQLEVIQQHFMEPGYSVLIECGWNTSNSISQKANLTNNDLCEITRYSSLEYITDKFNKSDGEYLGFLAFITGGDITNEGDSWILNASLTSIGILPSYMQTHRGVRDKEITVPVSLEFTEKELLKDVDPSIAPIGHRLFRIMFNELPLERQTQAVKNLEFEASSTGARFADAGNFVLADPQVRELINSEYRNLRIWVQNDPPSPVSSGPNTRPLNTSGKPEFESKRIDVDSFIGDDFYIRLELAFAIINASDFNLDEPDTGCSYSNKKVKTSLHINGLNTVCRAFPNIFSIDKSKLYIPNEKLPKFDVKKILTDPDINKLFDITKTIDTVNGGVAGYRFPEQFDLQKSDLTNFYTTTTTTAPKRGAYTAPGASSNFDDLSSTYNLLQIEKKSGEWGYLRDLFVNFSFFKSVISRPNLLAKDVFIELLNGISSAANSYWDFQLTDTPNGILIEDFSFSPEIKEFKNNIPTIDLYGKDSPLLTAEFSMDIPGAIFNRVLAIRLNNNNSEHQFVSEGVNLSKGIFTSNPDPITKKLTNIKKEVKETDVTKPVNDRLNQLEKNLNLFLRNASFITTKINDVRGRSDTDKISAWINGFVGQGSIPDDFFVGIWSDANLFTSLEYKYFRDSVKDSTAMGKGQILPIKLNASLVGISGLRVGDMFLIKGAPNQFDSYPFQIVNVNHEISNQWITNIEAKLKNIKL